MNDKISTEQALKNAAASVEMEGFHLSPQVLELCAKALSRQIDRADYLAALKNMSGVSA